MTEFFFSHLSLQLPVPPSKPCQFFGELGVKLRDTFVAKKACVYTAGALGRRNEAYFNSTHPMDPMTDHVPPNKHQSTLLTAPETTRDISYSQNNSVSYPFVYALGFRCKASLRRAFLFMGSEKTAIPHAEKRQSRVQTPTSLTSFAQLTALLLQCMQTMEPTKITPAKPIRQQHLRRNRLPEYRTASTPYRST